MSSEYPARLYAAIHTGNPGDADFYRQVCRDSKDVLELGCGIGRISAQLAREGRRVCGIDVDPECVELTRALGIDARLGDMRDFSIEGSFDRIISPYNGLYCLLEETALAKCFERVAAHLSDIGEFWFDGYSVESLHKDFDRSEAETASVEFVGVVEFEGRTYDVLERGTWDPARQLVHAHYEHIPRDRSAVITTELPQRYLRPEELPQLLAQGGLRLKRMYGGFDGSAFSAESDQLVVCATRV